MRVLRVLSLSTAVAFVLGILFWNAFEATLAWTNTEEFCISCHEMQTNLLEYQESAHDLSRTGIVASCPDCHVPKEFGPKLYAKIYAVKDLYHHLLGTIDTPEKYEQHRLAMAQAVWKKMKATDSRECRGCHDVESMDLTQQEGRAARKHENLQELGKTCIDCHKGIAHELPEDYDEDE